MRLAVLNLVLAGAVSAYVTWGVRELRHSEACVYRALTIIDGATHHAPGPLLDALRAQFDEEC